MLVWLNQGGWDIHTMNRVSGDSEMYSTFSLKISKLGHTWESKPRTERQYYCGIKKSRIRIN